MIPKEKAAKMIQGFELDIRTTCIVLNKATGLKEARKKITLRAVDEILDYVSKYKSETNIHYNSLEQYFKEVRKEVINYK